MGNWSYNPTYRSYNPIYNWQGAHLVHEWLDFFGKLVGKYTIVILSHGRYGS